ncbi:M28 family metallopeptidase [Caulobacter mirabilis]|uniref:Peptidase M20 n=1 Tax=Caulobacter mirabilis TaxID=69666 RepID=A0A2D2AW30_9CAUL|nr:M28 family metallopeptidase [Caulobacter mirabilis]ATQ42218.1 peptidase M20 [Caulobacter mirabilis]
MTLRLLAAAAVLLLAAGPAPAAEHPISPERLAEHVKVLASDEFAGRAPGGPGEPKTIDYIVGQFRALGLQPAGDKGGWTQDVPLVRTQVPKDAALSITLGGETRRLAQGADVMVLTQRPVERVKIDKAPLVFVGYGVDAPERGWDDFKGVDLKGKVAVFLINDPDFEAAAGDPVAGKFGGNAATYYARWSYKYEEAVRRGAIAALIVHETAGAAYPWTTVQANNGESFDVVRADPAKDRLLVQGWIQREVAVDLFRRAGLDFEAEKRRARTAAFTPVALKDATLSTDYALTAERLLSRNVLAKIPGGGHPDESIMFAAHWDAYGIGPADASGDTIRHGAADDAIGVAGVIEIARAFAKGPRPDRTLVFAAWTGEERGLLGSEYYAAHPSLPLDKTAANFTLDVLQTAGPSRDVVLVGAGQNSLENDLAAAAARQGRVVTPDARPDRALFYRADHFSLAKRGVPVLLLMGIGGGPDLVEGGREAGDRWVTEYTTKCYHQPCDNWSEAWDLRGAADDVALVLDAAGRLANERAWPDWNAGSEFRAIRARSATARK